MEDDKDLKQLLHFPCEFPIKIMGLANEDFEITVLHIVHKHFPDLAETAIRMRHSKDKKYLSLTVTVNATSQKQLDAVYQELSDAKQVIMVL